MHRPPTPIPTLRLVTGLLLAVAIATACGPSGPPDVILISADTLRADHLGVNGYPRDTTPTLDALAARGVNFENAYAHAPNTAPSHTSILTSLYPSVHGVFGHGQEPDPRLLTLAEVLRAAGYQTGAFTQLNGRTFRPGFDSWHYLESGLRRGKGLGDLSAVTEWVGQRTAPWFLFLHSYDVHLPYAPPPEYVRMWAADYEGPLRRAVGRRTRDAINDGSVDVDARDLQFLVDLYDAELRRLDDVYGRFFSDLAEMGALDDAVVVFLADHGEEFGEHGQYGRHNYALHQELLRVPLILAGPGVPAGRTVEAAVRMVDVAPTILDLAGVEPPGSFLGESLVPVWEGTERGAREVVVERRRERALIHAGYAYTDDGRLHDLEADRWGTRDVAADHPDVAARMERSLARWATRLEELGAEVRTDEAVRLTAEEERRLRMLGYLR